MRTILSPLMSQIQVQIRNIQPSAMFSHPNLAADNFTVQLGRLGMIFSISPAFDRTMEAIAEWPVYVCPVPPPTALSGSWECRTMEEIMETLRWPGHIPNVRIKSVAELRAEAGIG